MVKLLAAVTVPQPKYAPLSMVGRAIADRSRLLQDLCTLFYCVRPLCWRFIRRRIEYFAHEGSCLLSFFDRDRGQQHSYCLIIEISRLRAHDAT
jgi:hypothetical protein